MAKLEIDLSAEEVESVFREAEAEGVSIGEYARQRLLKRSKEHSPDIGWMTAPAANVSGSVIDAENAAAIALLDKWMAENVVTDPDEIRRATEEYEELKRNLNANRIAAGETPVFP